MTDVDALLKDLALRVQAVRLTPADVLVLSGLSRDEVEAGGADALLAALDELGVQFGGVVVLEPGRTIDSLDLDAVAAHQLAASDFPLGESGPGDLNDGWLVTKACPVCGEVLEFRVGLVLTNDLRGQTYLDRTPLTVHAQQCHGSGELRQ